MAGSSFAQALTAGLALNAKSGSVRSAANSVLLPKTKPRTIGERFVVHSIRRREVTWGERSKVGRGIDTLKALDFGDSLLDVHSSQYPTSAWQSSMERT